MNPILTLFLITLTGIAHATSEKPNVVFILADDLGYADTTLYGHTKLYHTPNLERLAKRGLLFTRAYAASPLCSPTRASILTGQTPARTGFTAPTGHTPKVVLKATVTPASNPANKARGTNSITRLDSDLPTLGKQFKAAGYTTAHFGKWHLGPAPYSPLQHGFDVDLPHFNGPGPAGSFVAPWKFKNFKANHPGEHIEDRMASEAVKWLDSVPAGQPFFMNYWMFSVHAPFDAKRELIDKYRSKIDLAAPQKSPTYAAMVTSMDDAVGTLLDAIEKTGRTGNTIFVFTSDNGGNMYNGIREKDASGKPFVATPTSNAPLRGGKANPWEGGTRIPQIISWPGVTKPGTTTDIVTHSTDFYPTLLTGLGIKYPDQHPIDGVNIMPALRGQQKDRGPIFTYFPHNPPVPDWIPPSITVTAGNWKLIRLFHQGQKGKHAYHLFDLANDIGETNNLATSHPEKVTRLDTLITAHLTATNAVVPQPNPKFDPEKYNPASIGKQPGGLKIAGRPPKKPKRKPAAAKP